MAFDQLTLNGLDMGPAIIELDITASTFQALPQVQQRCGIDPDKVREYAQLYREGRDLSPIMVFYDATEDIYRLADGFHRVLAAKQAHFPTLPADVHEGGLREAILFACGCNLHGKSLTNADKRRRIRTLLSDPEWQLWSDNHIAKHTGTAHTFVASLLGKMTLESNSSEDVGQLPTKRTYRDRHGNVTTMAVGKIGRQAPEAPALCVPSVPAPSETTCDTMLQVSQPSPNGDVGTEDVPPVTSPPPVVTTPPPSEVSPPAPPMILPPLEALLHNAQRSLSALIDDLQGRSLPDALEEHTAPCITLGEACLTLGRIITQHPAIYEGVLGAPPAPEASMPQPKRTAAQPRMPRLDIDQVERTAKQLKRFTCTEMARRLGKRYENVWRILIRLVEQGAVAKEGGMYRYIPPRNRKPATAAHAEERG